MSNTLRSPIQMKRNPASTRYTRASREQLDILRAAYGAFGLNQTPTVEGFLILSSETGLTPKWIQAWFKRVRQKDRRNRRNREAAAKDVKKESCEAPGIVEGATIKRENSVGGELPFPLKGKRLESTTGLPVVSPSSDVPHLPPVSQASVLGPVSNAPFPVSTSVSLKSKHRFSQIAHPFTPTRIPPRSVSSIDQNVPPTGPNALPLVSLPIPQQPYYHGLLFLNQRIPRTDPNALPPAPIPIPWQPSFYPQPIHQNINPNARLPDAPILIPQPHFQPPFVHPSIPPNPVYPQFPPQFPVPGLQQVPQQVPLSNVWRIQQSSGNPNPVFARTDRPGSCQWCQTQPMMSPAFLPQHRFYHP